jgi:hypothetical protein
MVLVRPSWNSKMSLNIFSLKRAFTARQKMALAAGNCHNSQAALKAKDTLNALYLGLDCEVTDCGEFYDASSTIDEFIADCTLLLQKLSTVENNQVTIQLTNRHNLSLNEINGYIQMQMDNQQVTLPNLTIQHLYNNLIQDIHNNPDLYGTYLTNYAHHLEQCKVTSKMVLNTH